MTRLSRKPARRAAWAGVAAAGAAALLAVRPSRGQQPAPGQPGAPSGAAVQMSLPAAASGPRTRVDYRLTLPAGLRLREWPRVDIFDTSGKLLGLVPTRITQRTPVIAGFVRLHTKDFPAGNYRIAVEANLILPDGSVRTVTAPLAALAVPPSVGIAGPPP